MSKAFLWSHEVGEAIGLSAKTINRMADAGLVEVIRDAKGRRRFRPEAVDVLKDHLRLRDELVAKSGSDPEPETAT
jgi:DNA-binding transcriptional MerR regulator